MLTLNKNKMARVDVDKIFLHGQGGYVQEGNLKIYLSPKSTESDSYYALLCFSFLYTCYYAMVDQVI